VKDDWQQRMSWESPTLAEPLRFRSAWIAEALDGELAFGRMSDAFEQSWNAGREDLWEAHHLFAGRPALMRVAGNRLASLVSLPFCHLVAEQMSPAPPALSIALWDERETCVPLPADIRAIFRQIAANVEELDCFVGSPGERFVGYLRPRSASWLDRANGRLVGWVEDSDTLPLQDQGKPLYAILSLWHRDRHTQMIHAGLVSEGGRGVLLAGKGDSGKTTAALACLEGGFDYLGDDYIALENSDEGDSVGHSLYNTAWVMADHVTHFRTVIPHTVRSAHPGREKSLALLCHAFPLRLQRSASIRVVLLPRITSGRDGKIRSASKRDALLALAPSTLALLPVSRSGDIDRLARLLDRVPCYWLDMGSELEQVPELVKEVLTEVCA
jgi:hypothetical protein